MRGNRVIALCSSLICIVLVSSFIICSKQIKANASSPYFSEPPRTSSIPSNIKWNTETGAYYDTNDYKWNSEIKRYEQIRNTTSSSASSDSIMVAQLQVQWYEKNKDTTDPLDKAIVTYYYNNENGIDIIRTEADRKKMLRSYYLPEDDYNLELITNLGIPYLPQMKSKIEANEPTYLVMVPAIYLMTRSLGLPITLAVGNKEYIKWVNAFNKLSTDIKVESKEFDIKLKNPDKNTEEDFNKFAKNAGLFILPHIKDSINKGNTLYIKYLPDIVAAYSKKSKAELDGRDISFWKNWFRDHDSDIEILRKVME